MPTFRRKTIVVQAVEWKNDDPSWAAVRELHAESELVAFWNKEDGTVSIETPDGRLDAKPGTWVVKHPDGYFYLQAPAEFAANHDPA
jgi:hypothetical protein